MEIIKIDAELAELPDTGVRYFGYMKFKNNSGKYAWEPVNYWDTNPWFISQDELIAWVHKNRGEDSISQLIILKAELPIKKLVME